MDREKIIRIIDELIFEAQKKPTWKAENALRCLKKELLKEQEAQKFFVDESGKITPLPVVVRCKDCKAWKQYDDMNLGECELYPEYNKMGDWFCNFGERK